MEFYEKRKRIYLIFLKKRAKHYCASYQKSDKSVSLILFAAKHKGISLDEKISDSCPFRELYYLAPFPWAGEGLLGSISPSSLSALI